MPDEPVAVAFAETGEAARINYTIPMPGAHTGRRIVRVDLSDLADGGGLGPDDISAAASEAGSDPHELAGVLRTDRGVEVDLRRARRYFLSSLRELNVDADAATLRRMDAVEADAEALGVKLRGPGAIGLPQSRAVVTRPPAGEEGAQQAPELAAPVERVDVAALYRQYLQGLAVGDVAIPAKTWGGGLKPTLTDVGRPTATDPALYLVEIYGISSFLGDYGMGRTIRTFTLLPGETTTISLKTWQSTKESIAESSSIIDSHEQSARERFSNQVQNETTDKSTKAETEKWHVEASLEANWGFGSASVSAGGSGEYQSGREQFSKQATEAVSEHAAEASSKRELSVTSSSEKTAEAGSESLIERTITNANVRRVLNFVFRELNQVYVTKLHLKDVRIAFFNGKPNSWREAPLSGTRPLLDFFFHGNQQLMNGAAQRLLKVAGVVFDREDLGVNVLQRVTLADDGLTVTVADAAVGDNGEFPPPTPRSYYRFRPGPLNQDDERNPVDGVLLSQTEIVMRTDSVVVEALLGQADALDEFAMEIQQAAAAKQSLANRREELLQATLAAIEDPERRAELAAAVFAPAPKEQQA